MAGGGKATLKLEVNEPGWIYVCLSSEDQDLTTPYLKQESWEPTNLRFNATGASNGHFVFRKWYDVGDYELPRLNFRGPIPLFPKTEK
ncbi:hypothetical protein OAG29_02965 [Planctomycetaceae bacterium]|jgi:hypothetical protein|nr:hypothetical protein [Planctomycetaceae bacterium]